MKAQNNKHEDKEISLLLSAVDLRANEPDRRFLNMLKRQSTVEFLARSKDGDKQSEKTIPISKWRIFMKNRIKLAAAATIVLALLVCKSYIGGSVELTTIAFAEISRAMRSVPWMHSVSREQAIGKNLSSEEWIGFEAQIHASKLSDGNMFFTNMKEHKSYRYSPEDRSITVRYIYDPYTPEDYFPFELPSANTYLADVLKVAKERDAEMTTREVEFDGQQAQLQEISLSVMQDNESLIGKLSLYVQPYSRLLLCAKAMVTDSSGNIVGQMETAYSYPRTGPADIYDLGAPNDAAIVSKLPEADYQVVWDSYRQKRTQATTKYIAVISHTDHPLGDVTNMVDVDYKSGLKHRLERHFVFNRGERIDKFWPERKEQLGDSFESLVVWAAGHYEKRGYISIHLYDGGRYLSTARDGDGGWSEPRIATKKLMPEIYLQCLGWPEIGTDGHIIEDDYSVQNNLICIERLQQGNIYSGNVSLPGRFVYYLDPQKDYICRRKITEWRPDAAWQRDRNWLAGIEPDKINNGSITVADATEVMQAPNGHWYPTIITVKQSGIRKDYKEAELKVCTIKKIYVRTDLEFPEDIFDADKLPIQQMTR